MVSVTLTHARYHSHFISILYHPMEQLQPTLDAIDLSSPLRRAPKERVPPPVRTAFAFDTMESAIAAIACGNFVVIMDDESRENEGDLIIPDCSTEQMAWMIKHTRFGLTVPYTPHSPILFSPPFCSCTIAGTSVSRSRQATSKHCQSQRWFHRTKNDIGQPTPSLSTTSTVHIPSFPSLPVQYNPSRAHFSDTTPTKIY